MDGTSPGTDDGSAVPPPRDGCPRCIHLRSLQRCITPKQAAKIIESFRLEYTLKIIEFNQINRCIQKTFTAAKRLALKSSYLFSVTSRNLFTLLCSQLGRLAEPPGAGPCSSTPPTGGTGSFQLAPALKPAGLLPAGLPEEEPPKPTRLSWQSAQWGKKERLENPGKRFNMSSDKLFLTRGPKLGFLFFFPPRSFFI